MDPIYNEDKTLVAICYVQSMRHIVTCPSKNQYVFVVQANICMSWVRVGDDEQYILHLKGGCCGQKKEGVYTYASEQRVRIWTNKGGS